MDRLRSREVRHDTGQLAPVGEELAQFCYVQRTPKDKTYQVRILPRDGGVPVIT
ncbi:hypothetical protein [Dactylosporangium sp. CA-139066]|uniref:hypothetical protein n=1 Tax=Dactylosporangium sp. CA-139066 TaxID=3239930 RepID=UPI003D8FC887